MLRSFLINVSVVSFLRHILILKSLLLMTAPRTHLLRNAISGLKKMSELEFCIKKTKDYLEQERLVFVLRQVNMSCLLTLMIGLLSVR